MSKPFRFKQFEVYHDRCSHKVGTDGVLLGCWVHVKDTDRLLLDVGAGSGLISLMLAQRTHATAYIDAVEVCDEDATQARENVLRSPWPNRIGVHHVPVQAFDPGKRYDLIVTNPPYFRSSLLPPDQRRTTARHANHLSFSDLLDSVLRLLSPGGRFALILPPGEASEFTVLCGQRGLFRNRKTDFHSRKHKPPERVLLEFSLQETAPELSRMTLYEAAEIWSQEYRSLTEEFYIKG